MDYSERRRRQGERTEQAILNSAITLMRERGFGKVSVRDICAHAGITTGAFYHHFRSKDELLSRGLTPMNCYLEAEMAGHEQDPPAERLKRILHTYASFMEGIGRELAARYYQQRLAGAGLRSIDEDRHTLKAILGCFREAWDKWELSSEFTPEWVARFCYAHFRGVVIDWVLSEQSDESLTKRMEDEYRFFAQRLALTR